MSATFLIDLVTSALAQPTVDPQTVASATTVNGSSVDTQLGEQGPVTAVVETGALTDATLTVVVSLQDSATGTGGWATPAGNGVFSVTLVGAGGGGTAHAVNFLKADSAQRFVRAVVVTTGGGTLSCPVAVSVLQRKKITGSGAGTQL